MSLEATGNIFNLAQAISNKDKTALLDHLSGAFHEATVEGTSILDIQNRNMAFIFLENRKNMNSIYALLYEVRDQNPYIVADLLHKELTDYPTGSIWKTETVGNTTNNRVHTYAIAVILQTANFVMNEWISTQSTAPTLEEVNTAIEAVITSLRPLADVAFSSVEDKPEYNTEHLAPVYNRTLYVNYTGDRGYSGMLADRLHGTERAPRSPTYWTIPEYVLYRLTTA